MELLKLKEYLTGRNPRPAELRRPSAVLVLLAEDELVLEVRARSLRRQPGEICLPGGGMEPEETAVDCALRETEEELGLPRQEIAVLGQMDYLLHSNGQTVYPVLARCDKALLSALRPNDREVERVFTVPLDFFRQTAPCEYQYHQKSVPGDRTPPPIAENLASYPTLRRGPYWMWQDCCIWGLTARIIGLLLETLEAAGA